MPIAAQATLTCLIAVRSVTLVSTAKYRLAVCALAILLLGLMTIHITGPWQYRHEDNGAWFSAVARTHLRAGLSATRGQDFFQYRSTGQLKPYLHHPPLLGLYVAAVFRVTGSSTPAVARSAVMAIHFCSFLVFVLLVRQIFPTSNGARLWALMVFAASPMSVVFGKNPSHEPLGLFFFLLGVYVCFMVAGAQWKRNAWIYAAGFAWALAAFSAWHAVFCIVGFVPYLLRHRKDSAPGYAGMTLMAVLGASALVELQLVWANHGHLESSALPAAVHWIGMGSPSAWGADYVHSMTKALVYALEFYGYVPLVLATVWLAGLLRSRLRGRRLADRDLFVLFLSLGSWIFSLIFSRAVGGHVYYQFYLLPSIALSSAIVIEAFLRGGFLPHHRRTALIGVALTVLLTAAGCAAILAAFYHQPYEYAVNAARNIQQQFY